MRLFGAIDSGEGRRSVSRRNAMSEANALRRLAGGDRVPGSRPLLRQGYEVQALKFRLVLTFDEFAILAKKWPCEALCGAGLSKIRAGIV